MQVGVISDIHANQVALEAVLDDMPPVDRIVNAGDVVGYNPWPAECLAIVREQEMASVIGNHDRAVASEAPFRFNRLAKAGVEYALAYLDDESLQWLDELPDQRLVADDRIKIVHGHPADPNHYTYPEEFSPELLGSEEVLVMGHTHVQHVEEYPEGIVLNPGSVGQPRDNNPKAAYAVVDLDEQSAELSRVSYDIDAVIEAIEAADLPKRTGLRLREGE
jgi:putative phosphoesterase